MPLNFMEISGTDIVNSATISSGLLKLREFFINSNKTTFQFLDLDPVRITFKYTKYNDIQREQIFS